MGAVGAREDNLNPFDNSLVVNEGPLTSDGTFSFFLDRIFFYSVS
jgi:hypothetical protein|tara:strand:+ start:26 stop:160 length:135 start_codon:yes stop_codon:yes gene_type:complete